MKVTSDVIRFIARLPEGALFATKELVHCVKRDVLDQSLSRLCKKGRIIRVAQGVYQKPGLKPMPLPTPQEVATAKAKAWGKRIMETCFNAAAKLDLVEAGEQEHVFENSGCTTSFNSIVGKIVFRKSAPKKVLLGNSKVATSVKALLHMGRNYCESTGAMKRILEPVWQNVFEREELITFSAIIPSWMRDKLDIERFYSALHWERSKRTPIDRLTKTTEYFPGPLREPPNLNIYGKPV
jgi:hypothetical protein